MNLNKYQIIWLITAIVLLVIFLQLTPISLFFDYDLIISMVESAICTVFIALAVMNITSIEELSEKKEGSNDFLKVFTIVLSFIVLSFVIFNVIDSKIEEKLQKEGKFTKAIVLTGEQRTRKRRGVETTSCNVTIRYIDVKNRKKYRIKTSIDAEIFNSLYEKQIVEIKYLPTHHNIVKLMVGNKNIKKYKKKANRTLVLSDVDILINTKNKIKYLNSISEGWQRKVEDEGILFFNELKNEGITIFENGRVCYKGPNIDKFIPKDKIIRSEKLPVEREDLLKGKRLTHYETVSYMIVAVEQLAMGTIGGESYLIIEKKE